MTQLVQTIVLGLLIGVYALLAGGLALIFGVMDVINVAQGALLILAAFIAWTLWHDLGIDPLLTVPRDDAADVRAWLAHAPDDDPVHLWALPRRCPCSQTPALAP